MSLSLLTITAELLYQGGHSSNLTASSHSLSKVSGSEEVTKEGLEHSRKGSGAHRQHRPWLQQPTSTAPYSKAIPAHTTPTSHGAGCGSHTAQVALLPRDVLHLEV